MPPPYGILKFSDDEEMSAYFDKMRAIRKRIELGELWTYDAGNTLDITSSLDNEDPQEGLGPIFSYQYSSSKAKPQPLPYDLDAVYREARPPLRLPPTSTSTPCKITLSRPLSTGEDLNSQVWIGLLEFPETPPMQVVVKIFDHVMQKPCSDRRIFFGPIAEYMDWWMSAGEMFMRELWTYQKLKPLQGKLLPRSYGFFNVKLPCGEEAPCHIMEFIEGQSLKERIAALGGFTGPQATTVQSIFTNLLKAITVLHDHGVFWNDVSLANVLIPEAHPEGFVFLDFGMSSPVTEPFPVGDPVEDVVMERKSYDIADAAVALGNAVIDDEVPDEETEELKAYRRWFQEEVRWETPWNKAYRYSQNVLSGEWPDPFSDEEPSPPSSGASSETSLVQFN